jgi:DNA-binding winged helix-turn-helix (wHTH) protein
MKTNTHSQPVLWHENPALPGANRSSPAIRDAALEFGRFRVLLRQRQLLADGVPVELGTRAFDLLLALLEADGLLLTKEELVSRVWPDVVVSEENLKVQVSALRKALGADRDVIHTEFGRGYCFTGVLRSNAGPDEWQSPTRAKLRFAPPSPQVREREGGGHRTVGHPLRCSFSCLWVAGDMIDGAHAAPARQWDFKENRKP